MRKPRSRIGMICCCYWPLHEVEDGRWQLNYRPKGKGLKRRLQAQIRFRHLFRPGQEGLLADLQAEVDRDWAVLEAKCGGNIGPATHTVE